MSCNPFFPFCLSFSTRCTYYYNPRQKREQIGFPLYLGETGENDPTWFAAMYPIAADLDIGYNIWPWKKVETNCSPCSVRKPALWHKITGYTTGGGRPSYEESQAIFTEYLENIKFENCDWKPEVIASILRRPGCVLRACDTVAQNEFVTWVDADGLPTSEWDKTVTRFAVGGEAEYHLYSNGQKGVIHLQAEAGKGRAILLFDGEKIADGELCKERMLCADIPGQDGVLTIKCIEESFDLKWLRFEAR